MPLRIHTVTFDCTEWEPLVTFWSAVTGFADDPDNPNEPGDPEGVIVSPDGSQRLLFIPVPEPKSAKNRVHFDLIPVGSTRDEEVERVLALGATMFDDRRKPDGSGFAVLADPEGNEFCVERTHEEAGRAG